MSKPTTAIVKRSWLLRLAVTGMLSPALVAALLVPVSATDRPSSNFVRPAQRTALPEVPAGLLPSPSLLPTLPLPSPSLPPLPRPPLPTPSLPVSATPIPPTPTPGHSPSPPSGVSPNGGANPGGGNSGGGSSPPRGGGGLPLPLPFVGIVLSTPLDVALAVALAVLPLLAGIWLLVFGRTWNQARQARDAGVRLALANDLGLSPRELGSLSTKGLFKLREQAAFDDLTGVMRRAAGIAAAEREVARARRQKSPLAVAFIDVDGLKRANDSRGHAAGDQLLRGLASGLRAGLRGQDLVIRYGGDEFVCVLPDTTADAARTKLHQIRSELASSGIGFSIGLVQLERSDDVVSVLGRADAELYEAKARRPRAVPRPDRLDKARVRAV